MILSIGPERGEIFFKMLVSRSSVKGKDIGQERVHRPVSV